MSVGRRKCDRCGFMYQRDLGSKREDDGRCPTLLCVAIETWDDERWTGAAHMATARKQCSLPLTDVDAEALRRSAVLRVARDLERGN